MQGSFTASDMLYPANDVKECPRSDVLDPLDVSCRPTQVAAVEQPTKAAQGSQDAGVPAF